VSEGDTNLRAGECAHTDRHTPMTTRPCGLRRAGNNACTLTHQLTSGIRDSKHAFVPKSDILNT